MRKVIFLFITIFSLPNILWAADPIIGTWELNVAKSKEPEGTGPHESKTKSETWVYTEKEPGLIEIKVTRSFMDGKSDFDILTFPAQGGLAQSINPIEGLTFLEIYMAPGEWLGVYIADGKQLVTRHKVVSDDGKTLIETGRAIDDKGPFEVILVFEKQ